MAGRPENLKPFKKGHDPRRNRKGRPKDLPGLRELALSIAHETVPGKDGRPLEVNGHAVTVIEAVIRQMLQSKNPRDRQIVLEYMFGKVPAPVEVRGAVAVDHTHHFADKSDDDIQRDLAALGQSALAASGRAPVHDDPGDAEGDDPASEEE